MTISTKEERQQRYVSAMGEELGIVYAELSDNLIELQWVWQQYTQLFGAGKATVDLLNRTSGLFFTIAEKTLWDMIIIMISRASDKESSGRGEFNKNMTLKAFPDLIEDAQLKECVIQRLKDVELASEEARQERNKRIAHSDKAYALSRRQTCAEQTSPVSITNIKKSIKALGDTLNLVHLHYFESQIRYETCIDKSGARILIQKLRRLETLEAQR